MVLEERGNVFMNPGLLVTSYFDGKLLDKAKDKE